MKDDLEKLWGSLRSSALNRGADFHTAEDVAQETYLRALEAQPEDRGRLRAWFQVVSERVLFETWRKRRNRRFYEESAARAEHIGSQQESEGSFLSRWVDELPEPYGSVVRMRFYEERSVKEISDSLGRSQEAVRSQLRRGLQRLRVRAGEELPGSKGTRRLSGLFGLFELSRKRAVLIPLGGIVACTLVLTFAYVLPLSDRGDNADIREARPDEVSFGPLELTVPTGDGRAKVGRDEALPYQGGSKVHGRVLAPDGRPVVGARVFAGSRANEREIEVVSDDRGRFQIEAKKHLILGASHGDWLPSPRCYLASIESPDIDLKLGDTAGRGTIRVLDAEGHPVPGARVLLDHRVAARQQESSQGFLEFSAGGTESSTDSDGRASLLFPPKDWVEALVLPVGLPDWSGLLEPPREDEVLTVKLAPPLTLRGACHDPTGAVVSPATFVFVQRHGLVRRETTSTLDGKFEVAGLSEGAFALRASERDGLLSTYVEGVLTEKGPLLELVLDNRHTIRGQILDGKEGVVGARVTLLRGAESAAEGTGTRVAWTDEEGRFRFPGCPRRPAHWALVSRAGQRRTEMRIARLRPSPEEAQHFLPDLPASAPIEIEFVGPTQGLPHLVELRSEGLPLLVVLDATADARRFRSQPLPAGSYAVTAWRPRLGAWSAGSLFHDPDRASVHTMTSPVGSSLEVRLTLYDGCRREDAEVVVVHQGLDAYRAGEMTRISSETALQWNSSADAYAGTVAPGKYSLCVRGPDIADVVEAIEVRDGALHRLELPVHAGIETRLLLRSDLGQVGGWEELHLAALTPSGSTHLQFQSRDLHVSEGGCELLFRLPRGTTELRARTVAKDLAKVPRSWGSRSGQCAVETLERANGRLPLSLELQLEPESSDNN